MNNIRVSFFTVFTIINLFCAACQHGSSLPAPTLSTSTAAPSPSPTNIPEPGKCTSIGQTWVSPTDGATLVCVPASKFLMGAAEDDLLAKDNEKPQHQVYLDAYWIDSTEVTNINFGKCLTAGACHPAVYETTATSYVPYSFHPDYQNYPALLYESDAASEYCRWAGRRLPTEAEWEKAARGTDARIYPWGNILDCTRANYFGCNPELDLNSTAPRCGYSLHCRTSPVDSYLIGASPYGALNMAGNVWEWVADWYQADYYLTSPTDNPRGPESGEYRVIRGGGAKSLTQELRVTTRVSGAPRHNLDGQIGFRCAISAGN